MFVFEMGRGLRRTALNWVAGISVSNIFEVAKLHRRLPCTWRALRSAVALLPGSVACRHGLCLQM